FFPTSLVGLKSDLHGKGERDVNAALLLAGLTVAREHDEKLPTVYFIHRGRRIRRERANRFPQQLARQHVERAQLTIVVRRADEQEAAFRDDRTAVVLAARVLHPLRDGLGEFAAGRPPNLRARGERDRGQPAPWRRARRM